MIRRAVSLAALTLLLAVTRIASEPLQQGQSVQAPPAKTGSGWRLPPDAEEKKNPLTVDDKVLAAGKALFKDKCQRCHGPGGLGDGPDADPDYLEDMDLTNRARADKNPDGIVFYKLWNGRGKPKMPAFKEEITEQQAWAVVAYVQTLRKK